MPSSDSSTPAAWAVVPEVNWTNRDCVPTSGRDGSPVIDSSYVKTGTGSSSSLIIER